MTATAEKHGASEPSTVPLDSKQMQPLLDLFKLEEGTPVPVTLRSKTGVSWTVYALRGTYKIPDECAKAYFVYINPVSGNLRVAFQQFCGISKRDELGRTNSGLDILRFDPFFCVRLEKLRKQVFARNENGCLVIDALIANLKKIEEAKAQIANLLRDSLHLL
jgi:hypothetical protein